MRRPVADDVGGVPGRLCGSLVPTPMLIPVAWPPPAPPMPMPPPMPMLPAPMPMIGEGARCPWLLLGRPPLLPGRLLLLLVCGVPGRPPLPKKAGLDGNRLLPNGAPGVTGRLERNAGRDIPLEEGREEEFALPLELELMKVLLGAGTAGAVCGLAADDTVDAGVPPRSSGCALGADLEALPPTRRRCDCWGCCCSWELDTLPGW